MRGQRDRLAHIGARDRIIPARAGPTRPSSVVAFGNADHPRSCGANHSHKHLDRLSIGSSPLVRGQLVFVTGDFPVERIIPARAGPTVRSRISVQPSPDHPRSCGANRPDRRRGESMSGSSPLVRGQQAMAPPASRQQRIIPARAGPTYENQAKTYRGADHPRSCGANTSFALSMLCEPGSSPLVRGQPQRHRRPRPVARIIPARAGPTNSNRSPRTDSTDHPRSCGANCDSGDQLALRRGSSPLVRGQPSELRGLPERFRIIPARAGPTHRPHT